LKIDKEKCVNCRSCIDYCPVGAIEVDDPEVRIDQESCVECTACLRSGACGYDALYQPELGWPRIIRSRFSDPLESHPDTEIMGRGTAEMKTNDVTGRFVEGEVGFAVEMGRPGVSTSFADVEKVAIQGGRDPEHPQGGVGGDRHRFQPLRHQPLPVLRDPLQEGDGRKRLHPEDQRKDERGAREAARMTHTHHRRGSRESLERDYVVLSMIDPAVKPQDIWRDGAPIWTAAPIMSRPFKR